MNSLKYCTLLLGTALIMLNSCISDFTNLADTLEEDLIFEISTDLLYNIASLQVVDEMDQTSPENVIVELVQSDYTEVYTLAGKKDLSPIDGLLLLGVRKSEKAASSGDERMTLRFSAAGYYPKEQYLMLDSTTQNFVVELKPIANAEGIDRESEQFLPSVQKIEIDINGASTIVFDGNTDFITSSGNVVRGFISAQATLYEGTDDNKRLFQDILNNSSYINPTGEKVGILLNPAAMIDVNLTSGGQTIENLSFPAEITLPLDQNLFNPLEKRTIQAGDVIPAFYYDEAEQAWRADGFSIVKVENGQLVASLLARHFTLWAVAWANRSAMEDMTEECHLFVRLIGNTPDTLRGSYMQNGIRVNYEYTTRPEFRFYQIYSGCMSGNGFSLGGIVAEAEMAALDYFKSLDPVVFDTLTFDDVVEILVQDSPSICNDQTKDYLNVNLTAQNAGTGTLRYAYGNFEGSRQINLEAGENTISLPIPTGALNSWLYDAGTFSFSYNDECAVRTIARNLTLCDIPFGVAIGVSNPVPDEPAEVDINIQGECPDTSGNFIVRPTLPIFYRLACDQEGAFSMLGMIDDGILQGALPISKGKMYDFKVQLGNEVQIYEDVVVPTGIATYTYKEYVLTLDFSTGVLSFEFSGLDLPDSICDLAG